MDSEGIAVSMETLTHISGLWDWATTFKGSQQLRQPTLILSTGQWRHDNLLTAAESFFQTNAYHPFAKYIRGHTGPVPVSRKEAIPAVGKDTGTHMSIAHFCPQTMHAQISWNSRKKRHCLAGTRRARMNSHLHAIWRINWRSKCYGSHSTSTLSPRLLISHSLPSL